jgi:hypothetical protein
MSIDSTSMEYLKGFEALSNCVLTVSGTGDMSIRV